MAFQRGGSGGAHGTETPPRPSRDEVTSPRLEVSTHAMWQEGPQRVRPGNPVAGALGVSRGSSLGSTQGPPNLRHSQSQLLAHDALSPTAERAATEHGSPPSSAWGLIRTRSHPLRSSTRDPAGSGRASSGPPQPVTPTTPRSPRLMGTSSSHPRRVLTLPTEGSGAATARRHDETFDLMPGPHALLSQPLLRTEPLLSSSEAGVSQRLLTRPMSGARSAHGAQGGRVDGERTRSGVRPPETPRLVGEPQPRADGGGSRLQSGHTEISSSWPTLTGSSSREHEWRPEGLTTQRWRHSTEWTTVAPAREGQSRQSNGWAENTM